MKIFTLKRKRVYIQAFTLIELVVTISIFAFMTAFLLAKYGTFNQGELLTNLSYDVALTIRNAQSYGIDVKSAPTSGSNYSTIFTYPYGVHFDSTAGNNKSFVFFVDTDSNGVYGGSADAISTYIIQRGSYIKQICVGNGSCSNSVDTLDVTFKRPDPDAMINVNGTSGQNYSYAEITLVSTDNRIEDIVIRNTGQIAITNDIPPTYPPFSQS